MPTVRVTLPKDDLTPAQKERLIERVTATVGDFFEAEKQEDVRGYVMVQISETAERGYALGGEVIG